MRLFDFEKNTGKVLSLWVCRLQTGCFIHYLQIQQLSKTPALSACSISAGAYFPFLIICVKPPQSIHVPAHVVSVESPWMNWLWGKRKRGVYFKKKKSTPALFCPTSVTVHRYSRWSQTPYPNSNVWLNCSLFGWTYWLLVHCWL